MNYFYWCITYVFICISAFSYGKNIATHNLAMHAILPSENPAFKKTAQNNAEENYYYKNIGYLMDMHASNKKPNKFIDSLVSEPFKPIQYSKYDYSLSSYLYRARTIQQYVVNFDIDLYLTKKQERGPVIAFSGWEYSNRTSIDAAFGNVVNTNRGNVLDMVLSFRYPVWEYIFVGLGVGVGQSWQFIRHENNLIYVDRIFISPELGINLKEGEKSHLLLIGQIHLSKKWLDPGFEILHHRYRLFNFWVDVSWKYLL